LPFIARHAPAGSSRGGTADDGPCGIVKHWHKGHAHGFTGTVKLLRRAADKRHVFASRAAPTPSAASRHCTPLITDKNFQADMGVRQGIHVGPDRAAL